MFRYSCNPIALFDAPMSKGLGEGNSSALIKRTLQNEVLSLALVFQQYNLSESYAFYVER